MAKILVTGGPRTGKSALIRALADTITVSTDVTINARSTEYPAVATETGELTLDTGQRLCLVGVPAHDVSGFAWQLAASGAQGALVLACEDRLDGALALLDAWDRLQLPYMVVLTCPSPSNDSNDIREVLALPQEARLYRGDPHDSQAAQRILASAAADFGLTDEPRPSSPPRLPTGWLWAR